MTAGILVAGIGNIFLTDDGFGSEVARRLAAEEMPDGVRVADFGIRGVHLAYELLDGYDALILVDAMSIGEEAGTLALLRPTLDEDAADEEGAGDDPAAKDDAGPGLPSLAALDAHGMDPATVLDMLSGLGGQVGSVLVVGCEPASLEEGMGLTEPVAEAVEPAMVMVRELVASYLDPEADFREQAGKR